MEELIQKLTALAEHLAELDKNFTAFKESTATVTKVVEVVKEVPVEVIKEVVKEVEPDTKALELKVDDITGKLDGFNKAIVGLTSVAPVVEKAVDAVGDAVVTAAEAPAATPATDAFVKTEPLVTEETAATIAADAKVAPVS